MMIPAPVAPKNAIGAQVLECIIRTITIAAIIPTTAETVRMI